MSAPYKIFMDGKSWCATGDGFVNIQESLAGFGDSPLEAIGALIVEEKEMETIRRQSIRRWKCLNCFTIFERRWEGDCAPCPHCKAGSQYTGECGYDELRAECERLRAELAAKP